MAAASRTYTGTLERKSENTWCSGAFGHGPGGSKSWWVDEVGWARPRLGGWKLIFVEGGCMRVQGDDVTSQSFTVYTVNRFIFMVSEKGLINLGVGLDVLTYPTKEKDLTLKPSSCPLGISLTSTGNWTQNVDRKSVV